LAHQKLPASFQFVAEKLMFPTHETIVAPATPVGEGGIAIIRLSGAAAEFLLRRFFLPSGKVDQFESHRFYHGRLVDSDGLAIDEVMAVFMRAPRSYTREDIAEIHCHGSPSLVRQVVDLLIDGGARMAMPGEFTLRAFLNGRLDLTQAEAVIDLIQARSDTACKIALRQLDGGLSRLIFMFRDNLIWALAQMEALIDFPEDEFDQSEITRCHDILKNVQDQIDLLLAGFESGRVLRDGLVVLILGRPNVGKSSLLNVLLGESRAIVHEVPGTTRDTLEENLVLGGIPLRLIDTAGVRETVDPVEAEGVWRARQKAESADLVMLVVDGSVPLSPDDMLALELCRERLTLLVINKADLPQVPIPESISGMPQVLVSAHQGLGLDRLREAVINFFLGGLSRREPLENILLSDRRHRQALTRCRDALGRIESICTDGLPPEILALEIREALAALGEITGETTPEMILEQIFSRFCIGK
jgi:tRNA modification GTPase